MSKEMPQIYDVNPTHALLDIGYGYNSTPKLLSRNWFADVLVKHSGNRAANSDPLYLLLSLRRGKQIVTSLKNPNWLATAMLNLSTPTSVTSYCTPFPTQSAIILIWSRWKSRDYEVKSSKTISIPNPTYCGRTFCRDLQFLCFPR